MENCFRFLINVDQCLNMSNFDVFFYKLESQHKFHLNQVQLFGNDQGNSLRSAISDIRMYLDKYPYHVGDYQIIVAMRSTFNPNPDSWDHTMLQQLLQLSYELRKARIFVNSREQTEKALNLIMLYDADFSVDLPVLDAYLSSTRFRNDCALLLRHLGIEETADRKQTTQALDRYAQMPSHNAILAELMAQFVAFKDTLYANLQGVGEETLDLDETSFLTDLPVFLKDQLTNFQVFEANIDRNNRRQNILAMFRVIEFINMSVERPLQAGDNIGIVTLAQQCRTNWDKIWADRELETRYARMLRRYQEKLNTAAIELEHPRIYSPAAKPIPEEAIPREEAIASTDTVFTPDSSDRKSADFRQLLARFSDTRFSIKVFRNEWDGIHEQIRASLGRMNYELQTHAGELSRKYAAVLEERKRESLGWKTGFYMAKPETEGDLNRLAFQKEELLQELRNPRMNPSLSFQDQLNMESALDQANQSVKFYLRCISMIRAGAFLTLILVCSLMGIVHYTFLQPYVFQDVSSLGFYLAYIAALFVLMLLCWNLPRQHYRKKLKACILALQEDMNLYVKGYFEKAGQFATYINLLNRLDYITRYHALLDRAWRTTHRLSQGYLWHKIQIRKHLSKLQIFQGLIDLASSAPRTQEEAPAFTPALHGDQVCDVADCSIYWPQD